MYSSSVEEGFFLEGGMLLALCACQILCGRVKYVLNLCNAIGAGAVSLQLCTVATQASNVPDHCVVIRSQRLKLPCLSTKRSG